jgi:signal peptidase I
MKKHRFLDALFICFTVVTLLLASFIGFMMVTHTKGYAVQSDSMYPAFRKGSAVFVRAVDTSDLRNGDIITVSSKDGSRSFTHRITRVDTKKSVVYTKGDNEPDEDKMPADMSLITGRVWFSLPYLGYISSAVQNRMLLVSLGIIAVLLIMTRAAAEIVKKIKKGGGGNGSQKDRQDT